MSYQYPSGFRVGQRVRLIPGPRKYNTQIFFHVGDEGRVVEPQNIEGWPVDAVQVQIGSGQGALDACILKTVEFPGQTYLS